MPSSQPPDTVLLLLHGFGCTSEDVYELAQRVERARAGILVVRPDAPVQAISAHGGARCPAWYDYLTDHETDRREDLAGEASLRSTVARLGALLAQLRERYPGATVCAAGISQGGCIAIELAARGLVSTVFSMVAHPITAGGRGTLQRLRAHPPEWHALVARNDAVFPFAWTRALHEPATTLTVVDGGHWQSDDTLSKWLIPRLQKL